DDDERLGERRLIGQRQVDPHAHAGGRHGFELGERTAGQHPGWPAGREGDDAEIAPIDAAAEDPAQRLGACFLCGIALRVTSGALGAAVRALALLARKHAVEEAVAEALDGALDARNVDEIAADAEDHALSSPLAAARPCSMAARMRLMALSSPPKIASPTRKWPILSSTMVE